MKLPHFKIWVNDFIANTSHLTDAQTGKIIRALCKRAMGFENFDVPDACKIPFEHLIDKQDEDFKKYGALIDKNQQIARTRRAPTIPPEVHQNATKQAPNIEYRIENIESKKEERDLLVLPASPAKTNRSLAFEKFWKAYPKTNGSKKKTLERWKQIRGEARHEEIMRGLEGYFADCDKRRSAGEFVPEHPFPQKWLGEERWKTYLTEEGASAGGADFSIKTDAFLQACLETVRNGGSLQGRALAHVTTTLGESWREHV